MEVSTQNPTLKNGDENKLKDRRIRRTQQLLMAALEELLLEKAYTDITVQDIIDRANVGRSTFYAHFLDKDHLLKSYFEKLRDKFDEQFQRIRHKNRQAQLKGYPDEIRVEGTLFLFQHAQSNHRLYKALIGKDGEAWVIRQFQDSFTELLRQHMSQIWPGEQGGEAPLEILVQSMASSMIGLLVWWLEHDLPYSAEQINQWFHRLAVQPVLGELSPD